MTNYIYMQNFASFRGVYSREIGEKASPRLKRSGFVGMTGRYNGLYIDLESYQSVVYRVRGDGRAYLANIRTDNWVVGDTAEDIWQAVLLSSGYDSCLHIILYFLQYFARQGNFRCKSMKYVVVQE